GQMDADLLQKIKNFRAWLGEKNVADKKTYIGLVINFEPYDSSKFTQDQYLYKIQSSEIHEVMDRYDAAEIDFAEYKTKIEAIPARGGPLDEYLEQLKDWLNYSQQLEIYQRSLLMLRPKEYAYFNGAWVVTGTLTEKQLESCSGTYYRVIYGYGKNGDPIFIEDKVDNISDPVYISSDSLWHGDYSHYGMMFRLMAILYEKFTMQKNLLADLLKEIQENNEKIAEANAKLSKINKVQAQAAKQGDNAKVVIPAEVIMYFKKHNITMPTNAMDDNSLLTYENSNFNKRMSYLESNHADVSNLFTYVSQGKLKNGGDVGQNTMLDDLTDRDLLELGSLKEAYELTDDASAEFGEVAKKVQQKGQGALMAIGMAIAVAAIAVLTVATAGAAGALGLGFLGAMATKTAVLAGIGIAIGAGAAGGLAGAGLGSLMGVINSACVKNKGGDTKLYGTKNFTAGSQNKLIDAYWLYRNKIIQEDDTAQVRSVLGTYTEALFQKMKGGSLPFPCTIEGICSNKKKPNGDATNGLELKNWAPISNNWNGTGHYKYLAKQMGKASDTSTGEFTSGSNQKLVEAFDLMAHQKFYYSKKSVHKENLTEPDYDYNALILMYKLEAMASVYGDIVTGLAINYLTKEINKSQAIESLNSLTDPEVASALGCDRTFSQEDVKQIKSYIDGPGLFTEDENVEEYEKKTLTQCWIEEPKIKRVLNKLYGDGSTGLNADEVSLWSENMRIHVDQITTDGQTITTKMQRMMQRCNETTSLATQMLKSIGDVWKQIYSNIR
ncbi:MAG: hypothetical protein K2L24_01615, partial [Opitutales bacterium]|nr:hypothetical protein [Opitutales bacterium]